MRSSNFNKGKERKRKSQGERSVNSHTPNNLFKYSSMEKSKEYPINWYDILGCSVESSKEGIAKAARKAALKYHPDRNSDESAKEIFLNIQNAKDFLMDDLKRKGFDDYLAQMRKRKEHFEKKNSDMNSKRKKMKGDFESRLQSVSKGDTSSAEMNEEMPLSAMQLERLRKESVARMESSAKAAAERDEKVRGNIEYQKYLASLLKAECRVKVKWRTKDESHSEHSLYTLFKAFGEVEEVQLVPGKGNQAIVSFRTEKAALAAVDAHAAAENIRVTSVSSNVASFVEKKKAAVFSHVYSSSNSNGSSDAGGSSSNVPRRSSELSDMELMMQRALERESLLRAVQREGQPEGEEPYKGSENGNTRAATFSSTAAKPEAPKLSSNVGEVGDIKAKENDILARMKRAALLRQEAAKQAVMS